MAQSMKRKGHPTSDEKRSPKRRNAGSQFAARKNQNNKMKANKQRKVH